MGRQTAFPGIYIESMEVKGMAPPDRGFIVENEARPEKAIMEEAVERGITREFEVLQNAAEFTSDTVGDIIQEAESRIGPFLDGFTLKYNLKVDTKPEITDNKLLNKLNEMTSERSVTVRSRAFARTKNPFEPDVFEVSVPRKNDSLSARGTSDVYDVTVTVTK